MSILDTLQLSKRQGLYVLLAGIALFICVFFIARCESDAALKVSYKKEKEAARLDSIIYSSKNQALFYKKQSSSFADSIAYYKHKVATLDSSKKHNLIQYEKPVIKYRTGLSTNPDSTRQSFLSKRFPDLYPH